MKKMGTAIGKRHKHFGKQKNIANNKTCKNMRQQPKNVINPFDFSFQSNKIIINKTGCILFELWPSFIFFGWD